MSNNSNCVSQLTAPNAMESIVCILGSSGPSGSAWTTPFRPTSSPPATVQNLTCLTPTLTKCASESGRNSAWKIRVELPVALATFEPAGNRVRAGRVRKRWVRMSVTLCVYVFTHVRARASFLRLTENPEMLPRLEASRTRTCVRACVCTRVWCVDVHAGPCMLLTNLSAWLHPWRATTTCACTHTHTYTHTHKTHTHTHTHTLTFLPAPHSDSVLVVQPDRQQQFARAREVDRADAPCVQTLNTEETHFALQATRFHVLSFCRHWVFQNF